MLALHISSSVHTRLKPQRQDVGLDRPSGWPLIHCEIKVLKCFMEARPGLSCPYAWKSSHHIQRSCLTPNKRWWELMCWRCTAAMTYFSGTHGPVESQPHVSWLTASQETSHLKWTKPTIELSPEKTELLFGENGHEENSPLYKDSHLIGALC